MSKIEFLSVENLSVVYKGFKALTNVSFDVIEGELVALIGPNGAGKTTVLNALAGAVAPTAGQIVFENQVVSGLAPHIIARYGLARTFQAAEPFENLTVRENVMVGAVSRNRIGLLRCLLGKKAIGKVQSDLVLEADRCLGVTGLLDKADQQASLLTAGQRRLLAIARVLATGAKLIVLDEPGAGLNESEKTFLGDVILALHKSGKTIIFIDHDMPLVSRLAKRIMVLNHGELIADGHPDEVRRNPKVVAAYLGTRRERSQGRSIAEPAFKDLVVPSNPKPLFGVEGLSVAYGGLKAVDDVAITVNRGEIVSLVGANGAGKSSILRAIAGVEAYSANTMTYDGMDLKQLRSDQIVANGICLVPEGRALFGSLTVAQNLAAGRYAARKSKGFGHLLWQSAAERQVFEELLQGVYDIFPVLKERSKQLAGTLSGGQGQMLAIGRALMGAPRLLMLDEPSLGLAPLVIEDIFARIEDLRKRGQTVLLVEQNSIAALEISDRGYVLSNGRITASGSGRSLLQDTRITDAYLGTATPSHHQNAEPQAAFARISGQ
ncbi:ATP-binding cassette domain-containing protein [Agrobacterium vitis]|uniref:ATP-binding cassette domain-containing protein n=1 Tax=Agrobacterium vitis TaxID=373 RepID=UPI003D2C4974